jgi:hypothetical protein
MKRLIEVCGLLAGLAIVLPAYAIEAYRLAPSERIVLDGKLDDAPWAKAVPWDRFFEVLDSGSEDFSPDFEVEVGGVVRPQPHSRRGDPQGPGGDIR